MSADHRSIKPLTQTSLCHDPSTHKFSIETGPFPDDQVEIEEKTHIVHVATVGLTNGELEWPEPVAAKPRPIPGYEFAGTVVSAPSGSPFQPGARVYARTHFDLPGNSRTLTTVHQDVLALAPANLSWEEAASVPISALTAWQALFVHAGLALPGSSGNAGKRLLVTAAAGGVGIWAVQLARLAGVGCIVGTCGAANAELVRSLGAHEVLDYKTVEDLGAVAGRDFDLVLDGVGGQTLAQAWRCARPDGGWVISVAMPADLKKPADGVGAEVKSKWFIVEANSEQLTAISGLLERRECKTFVDSVFELQDYEKAFAKIKGGHLTGKVVLKINRGDPKEVIALLASSRKESVKS